MNIENITVGNGLISDDLKITPIKNLLESGITCVGVNEKGFTFKRIHPSFNGEEFFLTKQALEKSHWTYAPSESKI